MVRISRLQDVAPRRAHRKRRIDQTDVRIGLGEIAALLVRAGDEMLRQEADVIGRRYHAVEDGARVVDFPQSSQGLGDPQRAYDKHAIRFPQIVFSDIPLQASGCIDKG